MSLGLRSPSPSRTSYTGVLHLRLHRIYKKCYICDCTHPQAQWNRHPPPCFVLYEVDYPYPPPWQGDKIVQGTRIPALSYACMKTNSLGRFNFHAEGKEGSSHLNDRWISLALCTAKLRAALPTFSATWEHWTMAINSGATPWYARKSTTPQTTSTSAIKNRLLAQHHGCSILKSRYYATAISLSNVFSVHEFDSNHGSRPPVCHGAARQCVLTRA